MNIPTLIGIVLIVTGVIELPWAFRNGRSPKL